METSALLQLNCIIMSLFLSRGSYSSIKFISSSRTVRAPTDMNSKSSIAQILLLFALLVSSIQAAPKFLLVETEGVEEAERGAEVRESLSDIECGGEAECNPPGESSDYFRVTFNIFFNCTKTIF